MQNFVMELMELNKLGTSKVGGVRVGQIVQIIEDGRVLVDYPGNLMGPVRARSVINAPSKRDTHNEESTPVLLVFENGDPALPIIVGIIRNTLYPPTYSEGVTLSLERPCDVVLDGKKIVFDAKEEIVLRCGKSSVTLRKDGNIVVKGAQIVSRASGAHKIKGASVRIN